MSELKFKPVPYDIVTSASTGKTTVRSTNANAPYNSNLLSRLQAIADQVYADNLFTKDDINFGSCEVSDLQKLLTQVVIRFDNDPNYYTKRDYQYLIWYLRKSLIYIGSKEIPDVDFEQLVNDLSALLERLDKLEKTVGKLQVNKRIFTTKAELEEAVKDRDFTVSGQIFSVTGDEDNKNGSYLVKPGTQEGTLTIIKLSTGAQTTLTLNAHEDVATLIDNVLTIKDMRTYWGDKSF
jgi:hypothetical protein